MSPIQHEQALKDQLVALLNGGQAHATLEDILADIPFEHTGSQPNGLPYSIWQLVEHIRFTQWDILDFSRNSAYHAPKWPDDYWTPELAPASADQWKESISQIQADRNAFISLVENANADLYTPFPHGDGQNLLREALLIADHTSHHLGQVIILRRLLHDWD